MVDAVAPRIRPSWTAWFIAFGLIVLGFIAATLVSQWRSRAIDEGALKIADDASPGIERLTAARGQVVRIEQLVSDYVATGEPDGAGLAALEEGRRRLDDSISNYLVLPVFPGEQRLWGDILQAKNTFDRALNRVERAMGAGDVEQARAELHASVYGASDELTAAITRDIEFNASESHDLAMRIQTLRRESTNAAFVLDALCVLLAVGGVLLVRRAVRAHEALAERHRALSAERMNELEQFAGRVAHDILSPLGVVGLVLRLAKDAPDDAQRERALERGEAAVARVKRLVLGLLAFARAGARPTPGVRADVESTLADLDADLGAAAREAGATLTIASRPAVVACDPGVLTSLISNLAHNAIKYIGDRPVREIEIRVVDAGERVRFEVNDTGPGLPPHLREQVFEPYVRGASSRLPGIGLGLATVKRVAEAHGGSVGVRSALGEGSTFWFELPRARGPAPEPEHERERA